ncbi:MAG TPA: MauE/DoxX family redox-associated membrane protein [Candidatus Limnocylindria bacterium]|nr:MauE/DoxX family redox-associated membrane protein [Candidatus Limnocylindria bacterium]
MTGISDAAYTALVVSVGATALWSAVAKVDDLPAFAYSISRYRIIPVRLEKVAAVAVVGSEFAAGSLMLTGLAPEIGGLIGAVLFSLFASVVGTAVGRGREVPCNCFGADGEIASWATVVRALLLALGSGAIAASAPHYSIVGAPEALLPLVLIGVGVALILRLIGYAPAVIGWYAKRPEIGAVGTSRASFKYVPPDASLFGPRRVFGARPLVIEPGSDMEERK